MCLLSLSRWVGLLVGEVQSITHQLACRFPRSQGRYIFGGRAAAKHETLTRVPLLDGSAWEAVDRASAGRHISRSLSVKEPKMAYIPLSRLPDSEISHEVWAWDGFSTDVWLLSSSVAARFILLHYFRPSFSTSLASRVFRDDTSLMENGGIAPQHL